VHVMHAVPCATAERSCERTFVVATTEPSAPPLRDHAADGVADGVADALSDRTAGSARPLSPTGSARRAPPYIEPPSL
jgi:hypothetical protein